MIAEKQMSILYAETTQAYGKEQKAGEFKAWTDVLAGFSYAQLETELRRWKSDTLIEDFTHKPRGSRMPTPAELKLAIDDAAAREARLATGQFVPCNKCEDGWIRVFSGKTAGGNLVDAKVGAVKRCDCWNDYVARKKGVSAATDRALKTGKLHMLGE